MLFKTTLSTKSYVKTIQKAKQFGFEITLVFFWLDTLELAIERVKARVAEGGHNIPEQIISRRYYSGLKNLFELYIPICDYWMIFNNSNTPSQLIAEGYSNFEVVIKNSKEFSIIKSIISHDKEQ